MPQHHDIVLQLERVEYIDSSGLGALERLLTTARTNGGDLKLCALQPPVRRILVRRILEMTNLIALFEIFDNETDAIVAAYLGSRYAKDASRRVCNPITGNHPKPRSGRRFNPKTLKYAG